MSQSPEKRRRIKLRTVTTPYGRVVVDHIVYAYWKRALYGGTLSNVWTAGPKKSVDKALDSD